MEVVYSTKKYRIPKNEDNIKNENDSKNEEDLKNWRRPKKSRSYMARANTILFVFFFLENIWKLYMGLAVMNCYKLFLNAS